MKPSALIPIFYVADVDAAVRYYSSVLGFVQSFRYGTYAGLIMGSCELHVTDPGEARQIIGAGTAYMLCDEVDTYFGKIREAGARLKCEPADRIYGMRDFAVFDLDGNQVSFGCDAHRDSTASANTGES
jgi:catechol 2,3-dioxygenase-like lactoylglutathione lyase family enzyme